MSTDTLTKSRWVYSFGGGSADGDASMKNLLGGKGANLAEMSSLGLPVPPGFTITTEACRAYLKESAVPETLATEVTRALRGVYHPDLSLRVAALMQRIGFTHALVVCGMDENSGRFMDEISPCGSTRPLSGSAMRIDTPGSGWPTVPAIRSPS